MSTPVPSLLTNHDDPRQQLDDELRRLAPTPEDYLRLRLLHRESRHYHAEVSVGLTLQALARELTQCPAIQMPETKATD